ncbi:uncharacterized protein LOC144083484 isoform X3 [Stigmatopora argus]
MRPDDDTAGGQILTDLREEPADRPREQLGQMHVATAFVVPGALDNVEEEQEEKNGVQPTHPPTSQGLLASPRDSRGFEPCPRHWADVDVDEGDWQNNATMRFLDSRRFWWECNVSKSTSAGFEPASTPWPSQPPGDMDILHHLHLLVSTLWETFSFEDCPSHKSSVFAFVTSEKIKIKVDSKVSLVL